MPGPCLAWGRLCSEKIPGVTIPGEGRGGWSDLSSSSPSCKCQNIPTTALAPAPPKLHSSVEIQLKKKKKKNVDVSPLPLGPRELKPCLVPAARF